MEAKPATEEPLPARFPDKLAQVVHRSMPNLRYFPSDYMFNPSDLDLLERYLKPKIYGLPVPLAPIIDVSVYSNPVEETVAEWKRSCTEDGDNQERAVFCFTDSVGQGGNRQVTVGGVILGVWEETDVSAIVAQDGSPVGVVRSMSYNRFSGDNMTQEITNLRGKEYKLNLPEDTEIEPVIRDRYTSVALFRIYNEPPEVVQSDGSDEFAESSEGD